MEPVASSRPSRPDRFTFGRGGAMDGKACISTTLNNQNLPIASETMNQELAQKT